jgi:DsbC/DsbD-like thiol-disulfide interchange protein
MLMKHAKTPCSAPEAGRVGGAILAALLACGAAPATADPASLASDWSKGYNAQTRLIAGSVAGSSAPREYAGVEIRLGDGWKTYWRYPGDAGGVPPVFDWSGSENLKSADVLYPAPHRLTDKSGDSIGYKNTVVFPVALVPKVAGQPIKLRLKVEYGVCREICIPAESSLSLTVPPGTAAKLPEDLATAIDLVPRAQGDRRPDDPVFKSATLLASSSSPKLRFEAVFPGGEIGADAFIEGPEGVYLPLPRKQGKTDSGALVFEIDLQPADVTDLKDKPLTVTLVNGAGQSEATFKPARQAAAQ